MNWYLRCWEHYADFKGRARRKEYWMFVLFNLIIVFILTILDSLLGWVIPEIGVGALGIVYTLAGFIPGLAVVVRRLHDIGKSGWCYLIAFIPIVGPIFLLVWLFTKGVPETNAWGPDPKLGVD